MLPSTSSQASEASSWNTTPMPSGASPAIGCPSNSSVPSVAGVRPAISSSSVDLPQPDGPTTAKNSPLRISKSIGPDRMQGRRRAPRHERLADVVEPDLRGHRARPAALLYRLEIRRQEARVDDLAVVDVAGDRADRLLRLDHPLQARQVDLPFAPVGHALRLAGHEVAHGAFRDVEVELVFLGDDHRGLVGVGDHELHRLAPRADHRAQEVALLLRHLDRRHADHVVERRQHLARDHHRAVLVLDLRPQRLGDRRRRRSGPSRARRCPRRSRRSSRARRRLPCSRPACRSMRASAWLVERGLV